MSDQFKDQGGAAGMDPSPLRRWLTSKVMQRVIRPSTREKRRVRTERARRRSGARHTVEYFHQVEDGYSHMAAQLLAPLAERYDVDVICHLVSVPRDRNLPEPELLLPLSRVDSAQVAPHYGLHFPAHPAPPDPAGVELGERILAGVAPADFPAVAVAVGNALWSDDAQAIRTLAETHEPADAEKTAEAIATGVRRRTELGHYSAAMFHYGKEWYWGADRFDHLEQRLRALGADRHDSEKGLCPRPAIESGPLKDDGSLTLEIYPSLRSPYTSFIFDVALKLVEDTGVRGVVRPVLPMVMRGVPATQTKGMYIFTDAAREAAALGLDWGHMVDPIGQPVRNCYSLYPWACSQGRGDALLSAFLRAAFFDGVNTNTPRGLRTVVENAGLDWAEAETRLGDTEADALLETNRLAMYDFGSWGVPSFRLLDEQGEAVLALWGQDRLWLFAREIQRLLAERASTATT